MGFASRRNRRRAEGRQRAIFAMLKLSLLGAVVGVASAYAFEVGEQLARNDIEALTAEVARLSAVAKEERQTAGELHSSLERSRHEAERYRKLYAEAVIEPELAELVGLMRGKLGAGLDKERLARLVDAAAKPARCGGPSTKRFLVRTPYYDGDATWVRFDDVVTVTATGAAAESEGRVEQWFDPTQPITVRFAVAGGKDGEVSGKLPLKHVAVFGTSEMRLRIAAGARGFVEVTADRCDFG